MSRIGHITSQDTILNTLKICLADRALMQHPTMVEVVKLHKKWAACGEQEQEGLLYELHQAQMQLHEMLKALDPCANGSASACALKQLRQIVHDAIKLARRQLRHIEHNNQRIQDPKHQQASKARNFVVLSLGIQLYFEDLLLVLDAWFHDLGSQKQSSSKSRKKARLGEPQRKEKGQVEES
jgi:hypothetical protein